MPHQASTDRDLHRTGSKQGTTGWRLLLLGGVLFGIGLILMIAGNEILDFIGVALAALASVPTLAGIGLILSGVVAKRHAQHKPFA
ncbi:MAG TPA: hypothetical protein VM253_06915 [Candidatus Limnocylindrales bacterium]|nr:hypothetical protein [Candidatus Limnocylindrales bacterium]